MQERRCSLIFPAGLEAAVRDGDVRDVMLAKDSDTILIKMKQGRNVSMDFADFDEKCELYEGEGPNENTLRTIESEELEKRMKRKRTPGLAGMKKIFEEKDKMAEIQELEEVKHKIESKKKVIKKPKPEEEKVKIEPVLLKETPKIKNKTDVIDLDQKIEAKKVKKQVEIEKTKIISSVVPNGDWRNLMRPLIESWDWDTFEREAAAAMGIPRITTLPQPIKASPLQITTEIHKTVPEILKITTGFENVPSIEPFSPVTEEPDVELLFMIKKISPESLETTANIKEKLNNIGIDSEEQLPFLDEIPAMVTMIVSGKSSKVNKVTGLTLDIDTAKKFVPGQIISTPVGDKFVPGQTVSTPAGPVFVPGFTVYTPSGPALVPGHTFMSNKTNEPIFVAGQTMESSEGEKFVHGQTIRLEDGTMKFIEGQTILSADGPKFVPGKISKSPEKKNTFIPGQTMLTNDGPQFIPGQTVKHENGDIFVPGQNICQDSEWKFVPGQNITQNNDTKFIPGTTLNTEQGPKFVAGQTITLNDGSPMFVPGITVEDNFIPGTTVETLDGPKFIQGQIMNTPEGHKFIPGKTIVGPNGEIDFAIARSIKDIVFMEPTPTGLVIDSFSMCVNSDSVCVFGHMVQTDKGIEFFPGIESPMVKGKIVAGNLIKGEEDGARFIPGMMIDECFVPGQIVFTEKGEKFVPGQVIETLDGPKFVPGQVVETKTGSKFVPGQTVETEEGPRFVPGQIVETKAGPTFIPGQVIFTEEGGSRFVPGQVVDTEEGPRFVPGRVVESSDRGVTFVPGQIVHTAEGLKFVAPDLTEGDEGLEFSVQSFVVTPEELKLLKVHGGDASTRGELSIDSKMLRQLSEAGMSVGRQVPAEVPIIDIVLEHTKNSRLLESFISTYGFKEGVTDQLRTIITSIIEMSMNVNNQTYSESNKSSDQVNKTSSNENKKNTSEVYQNGFHDESKDQRNNNNIENIKNAIAAAVLAATVIAEQCEQETKLNNNNNHKDKYKCVLNSIDTILGKSLNERFISSVYNILQNEEDKDHLCEQIKKYSSKNKVEMLKLAINNMVKNEVVNEEIVVEKLSFVLRDEKSCLGPAFKNISKSNSDLVKHVLQNISETAACLATEQQATDTLQKAIVTAVRQTSDVQLNQLLSNGTHDDIKQLLIQSLGLAKTLGMHAVSASLLVLISDPESMTKLANDATTLDTLRRLTVMRQLAERQPSLNSALRKLEIDPELARTDPKFRELVRESAALMIVPEEPPLQSSADVPITLFHNENSLAMEDFLLQRKKHPGTVLIMKKGLQAVVPRESSRAVLTGQVAYTLIDEKGISHFEPLHVFSALQLSKPTSTRFSMYCCQVAKDDDDLDSRSMTDCSSSMSDDMRMTRLGGWVKNQRGVKLESFQSSVGNDGSIAHTPSFRKLGSLCQTDSLIFDKVNLLLLSIVSKKEY